MLEDKGHKITMKISILDEPRSQPTLSSRPQRGSQSEPYPEPQPRIEDAPNPQSVPSSETQSGIKDALQLKSQSETQPDPRYEQIKHGAKEAEEIKSIHDRLGASITYLEGLLEIGDVVKDVSHSSLKPDH